MVGNEAAALFLPDKMREVLRLSSEISFDGTFFCCPSQFYQIFTVFAVFEGSTFPCRTALMTCKTQEMYEAVFCKILESVPTMNPEVVTSDFEQASRNAVKIVFPNIRVAGCSFHFKQATLRMARKQGLDKAFKTNILFRKLIKRIMHINFLPANQISPALKELLREESGLTVELESKGFRKLQKYIRTFWIDGIGPEVLLVFGLPRKINNRAETHHKRLKARILSHRPMIWKFLKTFNLMMKGYSNDIDRLRNGSSIAHLRRPQNVQNAERRRQAEEQLTSGKSGNELYSIHIPVLVEVSG